MNLSGDSMLLGEVVNYSLKGLIAAMGKGVGVTKDIYPVFFHVNEGDTALEFAKALTKDTPLREADIIVVPSKVVSMLEDRYVYGLTIENYTKCIHDLAFARENLTIKEADPISDKDRIGLDKIDPERKLGVRYPKDPNGSARIIAEKIKELTGINVDVVISDSDSGSKKGLALINCPTIIATPIGATRGLSFLYCMRVSVAAEATRNNVPDNPVLLVRPYQATSIRNHVGELRYEGFLDGDKEEEVLNLLNHKNHGD